MSYQIEYNAEHKHPLDDSGAGLRILMMSAAFFLSFSLLVNAFWPRGHNLFWNILFPGGAEPAMAAAEVFVDELRNGEPIADALDNFCRDVVKHGNLP